MQRRDYMLISEFNKENSTIRIHDDFCESKIENRLSQLNYIVSESYKRRKDRCRWEIKDNIEYDILVERDHKHRDMLDEIVELMVETICSKNETIAIASNTYPQELIKNKFLKINSEHIEYIIECVSKNTTKVSNIKQYMLAAIFNAPNTIGSYYTTRVNHDLYGEKG